MASFLRQCFSEDDGTGSFSRLATAFHVAAVLTWISHYVWHTHLLPDVATLGGLAAFAIAPYTANKLSGSISSFAFKDPSKVGQ